MSSFLAYGRALLRLGKVRLISASGFSGVAGYLLSAWTAHTPFHYETMLLVFFIILLSAFGSVLINNLFDQEMDLKMERTKQRYADMQLLGGPFLWAFSISTILFSFFLAFVFFHWKVLLTLILAVFTYVFWYTLLLKRKTPFAAVLGGIPGALPILTGAFAATPTPNMAVYFLFLWMILWQPPHFWALALKIKEEYAAANVPVLPVIFDDYYTKLFILLYGLALLPTAFFVGMFANFSYLYQVGSFLAGLYYLMVTYKMIFSPHDQNPKQAEQNYQKAFRVSLIYMLLLFTFMIVDIFV
ncbi:MAG: protoheme IX farnesyltransferase [Candidatus Hydrogenedentota bacterium]|nr:MAG: protoheme IX farnesyltransferase [Candidatus Hydrogenedentota bacterium]